MKQFNSNLNEWVDVRLDRAIASELLKNQEAILKWISQVDPAAFKNEEYDATGIGDYISEKEAMKILGKKTTWFWQMRTKGKLSFTKVGNKVFYPKQEIINLLNQNMRNGYRK